jgi:hypothetical protein
MEQTEWIYYWRAKPSAVKQRHPPSGKSNGWNLGKPIGAKAGLAVLAEFR